MITSRASPYYIKTTSPVSEVLGGACDDDQPCHRAESAPPRAEKVPSGRLQQVGAALRRFHLLEDYTAFAVGGDEDGRAGQ